MKSNSGAEKKIKKFSTETKSSHKGKNKPLNSAQPRKSLQKPSFKVAKVEDNGGHSKKPMFVNTTSIGNNNDFNLDFSPLNLEKTLSSGPLRISIDINKNHDDFIIEREEPHNDMEEDDTVKAMYRRKNMIQLQYGPRLIKK